MKDDDPISPIKADKSSVIFNSTFLDQTGYFPRLKFTRSSETQPKMNSSVKAVLLVALVVVVLAAVATAQFGYGGYGHRGGFGGHRGGYGGYGGYVF